MSMEDVRPGWTRASIDLVKKFHPAHWTQPGVVAFLPPMRRLEPVSGDAPMLAGTLGRLGSLEVRLARTTKEIRRAQRLRFKVFYEEMSAVPGPAALLSRRDVDEYDAICDHLLVIDHNPPRKPFKRHKPKIVGTYRLLRREVADRHFGFYSATEYDIAGLLSHDPRARVLELGRSCVLKPYRNKRTVELLWNGLYQYIRYHHIDLMFGCASLEGTDIAQLRLPLSYLHHFASAPDVLHARARPERHVDMNLLPRDAIDPKLALRALPPLVKGYLRIGATFGNGAVIDRQFGTTDVLVVVRTADIDERYLSYYGGIGQAQAA